MVAVRRSGGPKGGPFTLEWRGAAILQAWLDQIDAGVEKLAEDALEDLRTTIHEDTGEMRRQAFAEVSLRGSQRVLRLGSAVPYAAYEEAYHPQIRTVVDRQAPRLTKFIADARARST